jgi:hypothetical protein
MAVEFPLNTAYAICSCSLDFKDFKATFGENWREESTSLFNLFSDEFGEIPLRIRELAVSTAEEKAGYNYSSPNFKEA